ncbi:hypothetical protein ILUMI_09065 [Ignelater luminosus]|uniref:Cytochrome P450 n=1 Tax=Ignelater luminosus TaxID=2038154 RepID=A0A8K0D0I4_IGNLU|nr:hypothetical protein ILUMI_09065 [Ignelater luminosus]
MAIPSSEIFTSLLIAFLTLVTVGAIYFKWSFNYWKRKGVQSPPASIPFGNTGGSVLQKVSFGEDVKNIYDEYKHKGLKYAGMYFFAKPIFLVFDPELVKTIMTKDFQYFTDHGNYVNEEVDPLSGHLFSLKGLKWKNLRAKLTPTFTSGKMKMMFQTLVDCSDELINIMDKASKGKNAVDIKDVVGRYTTDIIGSCAFGIECNSLKNPKSDFREYGKKVFELDAFQALKNFISFCCPEMLHIFKVAVTRDDVTKFFMNVVNETVNYREANNIARKDFMHLLIQLKNNIKIQDEDSDNLKQNNNNGEVGKTLTMPELAAQAFVFFLAGFETSSTTLTFCFYELVKNPDIQETLRQEVVDGWDNVQDRVEFPKWV